MLWNNSPFPNISRFFLPGNANLPIDGFPPIIEKLLNAYRLLPSENRMSPNGFETLPAS
jgi:hypothetical protein